MQASGEISTGSALLLKPWHGGEWQRDGNPCGSQRSSVATAVDMDVHTDVHTAVHMGVYTDVHVAVHMAVYTTDHTAVHSTQPMWAPREAV